MPHQISREQRHDLRAEALVGLTDICEESALALQNDDWEMARGLRTKYEALTGLLDQLGWEAGTDPLMKTFELPDTQALVYLAPVHPVATKLLATASAAEE